MKSKKKFSCEHENQVLQQVSVPEYPERYIWINEFDEPTARYFTERYLTEAEQGPEHAIPVFIDSVGGDADALAAILSVVDSLPNPLITICVGKAMSCGAMLLAHGDHRFAGKHARVMVHEMALVVSGDGGGATVHDIKANAEEVVKMNKYFMELLAKDCGTNWAKMSKKFTNECKELFMTAEEALKFGIIDKIGIPQINTIAEAKMSLQIFNKPQRKQK